MCVGGGGGVCACGGGVWVWVCALRVQYYACVYRCGTYVKEN